MIPLRWRRIWYAGDIAGRRPVDWRRLTHQHGTGSPACRRRPTRAGRVSASGRGHDLGPGDGRAGHKRVDRRESRQSVAEEPPVTVTNDASRTGGAAFTTGWPLTCRQSRQVAIALLRHSETVLGLFRAPWLGRGTTVCDLWCPRADGRRLRPVDPRSAPRDAGVGRYATGEPGFSAAARVDRPAPVSRPTSGSARAAGRPAD